MKQIPNINRSFGSVLWQNIYFKIYGLVLISKLKYLFRRDYNLYNYKGKKNLHLGCGNKPLKDFINVDFYNKKYADQIINLNQKLPFESNSFDLIYSDNVFEHVQELLQLIQESYRVLKKDAFLIIKVPYFKSKHAFVDPTHVRFFTIQSMDYYIKKTNFNENYKFFDETFDEIEIYLDPENKSFIKKLVSIYGIKRPNHFENSILSNIFVFHNIVYVIRKRDG